MPLEKAFFYTLGNKIKEIRLELGYRLNIFLKGQTYQKKTY